MEEEKQRAEDIALKADRMLQNAGIDIGSASDNEGNVEDLEEHRTFNKLTPVATDANGLPLSMAKNNQKLPPLGGPNLIKLP